MSNLFIHLKDKEGYVIVHDVSTVEEYLIQLPEDEKKTLQKVRSIIQKTIPEVTERIAYKICVFSVKKDLVGFASQKNHLSFYTMSPSLIENLKHTLTAFEISGATIHFTPQAPLPKKIIETILRERLTEIQS